ncbi:SIR2 family protein [Neobacillus novalis]|uniref:SIR2 family protein n=1 Tax=Neobacillus novalis TaxID=220687 RepID=A0AA95MIW7_9BACI|nr:SIR2 family protein [Neobacillus novalis]WHY84637.1 SIR2 family protein [Neobacillus novalis]
MSLETLIATVSTDLGIDKSDTTRLLFNMVETVGRQKFTLRTFEGVFSPLQIDFFIKRTTDFNFLDVQIHYECFTYNDDSIASDIKDNCRFCREPIEGSLKHEIEYLYVLKDIFINEIRNMMKNVLQEHYLVWDYKKNLDMLKKEKDLLIPFIGAGLSMPFGLPNWGGLLELLSEENLPKLHQKEAYKEIMELGDYLEALDYLRKVSPYISTEEQIQEEISGIIEKEKNLNILDENHNYFDLLKLNSNFYITTNYDLCISDFLSREHEYTVPLTIKEVQNPKKLMQGQNQVIHLHGHVKKLETMIASKKSYQDLYKDEKFHLLLASIIGNRPLLFIGFSFSDEFFQDLYRKLNATLKTYHYIVLINPELKDVKKFIEDNIKVIGLNVKINDKGKTDYKDYVIALRSLINYLIDDN